MTELNLSREKLLALIESDDHQTIAKELIGIAFYEEDFEFAFKVITQCVSHSKENIRGNAMLCLGHLARIHKRIPETPTVDILRRGLADNSEYVRGQAY